MLHRRKKLIRIANTSSGGWETVRQYESNQVASDSDDENKIYKAESCAISKKKRSSIRGKRDYASSASATVSSYNSSVGLSNGFIQIKTWISVLKSRVVFFLVIDKDE